MATRYRVLVIGGSDPGGRAGVIRDVQTLHDLGTDAACALTAVTAQTDAAVLYVQLVEPIVLHQQVAAAFASGPVHAVKIGMLGSTQHAIAVADMLASSRWPAVVLDPVMAASSGGSLLEPSARDALCRRLLPHVTLLTPNVAEAAWLLDEPAAVDDEERVQQARRLHTLGARNVLLKGGHAGGAVARDILLLASGDELLLDAPRLDATMRGTGCALASAIAAGLAAGQEIEAACRAAKDHVHRRLQLSNGC